MRPPLQDSTGALERAVYAVLSASALRAGDGGAAAGVFDDPPKVTDWPHVQIISSTMTDVSNKAVTLQEATVTLRCGSLYAGGRELSALVSAVLLRMGEPATDALRAELATEGFHLVWHRLDLVERYRDQAPGGQPERYAAIRFRFHVQQPAA